MNITGSQDLVRLPGRDILAAAIAVCELLIKEREDRREPPPRAAATRQDLPPVEGQTPVAAMRKRDLATSVDAADDGVDGNDPGRVGGKGRTDRTTRREHFDEPAD